MMQKYKKLSARILSMALLVAMVTTMLSATVFAAEGDVPLGTSSIGTIKSFNKLEGGFIPSVGENAPDHIYALSVASDTPAEDLKLPTELTAMVERSNVTKPGEDTKDSGAVEQESIPVTWQSDKEYKSDASGKFIYTAEISEEYILADGLELPQIYVEVGRQVRTAGLYDCEIDLATVSTSADGYTIGSQTLTLTDSSKSYRLYGNGGSNIQMVSTTGDNSYNITLDNVTITSKPTERAFFMSNGLFTLLDGSTNTLNSSGETSTMRVGTMNVQGTGSLSVTASGADAGYGVDATKLNLRDGATVTATSEGDTNWSAGVVLNNVPSLGEGTSLTAVNQRTAIKFSNPRTSIPDTAITGAATVDGELSVAAISTNSSDAGMLIRMGQDGTGAIAQKVSIVYAGEAAKTITIDTQPTSPAAMTYGSITGSLTVAGTASDGSTVSYQWYQNTTDSTVGGTAVTDATSESFTIPTNLDVGTYYYYCILKAGDCPDAKSDVATVEINKANATAAMKAVTTTVSKSGEVGATVPLPAKPAGAAYGTLAAGGAVTMSNMSISGDTLTFTAPVSTAGQTGTITIPVTTATNYNDYTIVVTITSTDKKPATITAAVADKTYNGVAVTQPTPTAVEKDTTTPVTLTYIYKWQKSNESGNYTDIPGNTAPKAAGSYKLVIEGSSDTHAGTTEIAFTISKAIVTITAPTKSAYVGDAVPALKTSDCKITGLAADDSLKTPPTLVYDPATPDMSKEGSAVINVSGAVVPDNGNYNENITYVAGKLIIVKPSTDVIIDTSGGNNNGGGSPKTGDTSNVSLLFSLLLASGGALTALFVKRRRTGRNYSR